MAYFNHKTGDIDGKLNRRPYQSYQSEKWFQKQAGLYIYQINNSI